MSKAFIIARKDIGEALRSKSTYLYVGLLIVICLPYFDVLGNLLESRNSSGMGIAETQTVLQLFFNVTAATVPFLFSMLVSGIFSQYAVIIDKTKRSFESLLATPLSLREVWLGKCFAMAAPGTVVSLAVSAVLIVLLNYLVVVPATGAFVFPDPVMLATGFLVVPLMTFFIILLVGIFQFIMTDARIPNIAFSLIFMGVYMTTITKVNATWNFALIYLAITAAIGAATVICSRFLTKERVILSSKG